MTKSILNFSSTIFLELLPISIFFSLLCSINSFIAKLVIKYHSKSTKINFIKNNNKPSIRKYNSKKIMNIISNYTDLETGIKNYFKG